MENDQNIVFKSYYYINTMVKNIKGKGMGIGILTFMIIIPNIIFSYIVLGISSCASIAYIKMLKNENKIPKKCIHILLQLCFILDIVDLIILEKLIKKEKKIFEARTS